MDVMSLLQQGYQHQQRGELELACDSYWRVLQADPDNLHALNLLGMVAVNQGRPADAIQLIGRALQLQPGDPEAHANIALAHKDLGQFEQAVSHFRASLKGNPQHPVVHNNLANVLREIGQIRDALPHFQRAVELNPGYAQGWANFAAAMRDVDDYAGALAASDRALKLQGDLVEAWKVRGKVFGKLARHSEAIAAYDRALNIDPEDVETLVSKSDIQRDMDDPEAARATLEHVLSLQPDNPFAHHALGVISEQLGDRAEAERQFLGALKSAPAYASAWYQLAQLKGRVCSDDELAAMESLWSGEGLLREDRKLLAFALFRVYDQRGDTARAWEFLDEGNRIKAAAAPYSDTETHEMMQRIASGAVALRNRLGHPDFSYPGPRPVFVLGMPRSGTTLTEQVLAGHSQVQGLGEVSFAFDSARKASGLVSKQFPACVEELSAQQLREVGAHYMGRIQAQGETSRFVVDKTPLNFQYIGLLAQALPEALFIHCRRDPVDTCYSIHRIPFDERQTYAHSLESLGHYYRQYQRLMRHWHDLFPGRILDVDYEETVADLEKQARGMLDFLGLDFEPAVLEYYKAGNLVRTPSASQVREPIYRDSVQGWKRYESQLQPLIDALATSS